MNSFLPYFLASGSRGYILCHSYKYILYTYVTLVRLLYIWGACSCVEYGALEFKRADLLFVKSSRFHHTLLPFHIFRSHLGVSCHPQFTSTILFSLSSKHMFFPFRLASFLAISAAAGASPLVYPTLAARHNSLEAHSKYPTAVYILTYRLCFCIYVRLFKKKYQGVVGEER